LRGFDTTQSEFAASVEIRENYLSNAEHSQVNVRAAMLAQVWKKPGLVADGNG
jgi:hypothetical protein